jgi:ribosomal protein L7Ae-like RNA K-turn-binding protein
VNNKLCGLLGIAKRSGHILIGFDAVRAALLAKKARLVLLAADCSAKTEKELRFADKDSVCPILTVEGTTDELAAALGLQKPVAVTATDDLGFAKAMQKHIATTSKEDTDL